jgi:hypothetical protein
MRKTEKEGKKVRNESITVHYHNDEDRQEITSTKQDYSALTVNNMIIQRVLDGQGKNTIHRYIYPKYIFRHIII